MLSPEKSNYSRDAIDPTILAYSRSPFRWIVGETHEIPLEFACFGDSSSAVVYVENADGGPREVQYCLAWNPSPFPHRQMHVGLVFLHRELRQKVMSYDDVEAVIRKDVNGILPRLMIGKSSSGFYSIEYRCRDDFLDVFADILENGREYEIPPGNWTYVRAWARHLPFGPCDLLQSDERRLDSHVSPSGMPQRCCLMAKCPLLYIESLTSDKVPDSFANFLGLMDQSEGLIGIMRAYDKEDSTYDNDDSRNL